MPEVDSSDIARLIARWETLHHDSRQRSRTERVGDVQTAYYYKGVTDTLQQVINDLRALLGDDAAQSTAQAGEYLQVSEREVAELLAGIGLYSRDLRAHADHAFTAVFSRLQPITQEQRLRLMTEADPRIVILDQGKLSDSGDPFIDFAFMADTENKA
jgi:hypothetical protein